MRLKDIKKGVELYYSHATDWRNHTPSGRRAVVAEEGLWILQTHQWGYEPQRPRPGSRRGCGVLVNLDDGPEGKVLRKVVPLSHLRGPYAQVKAQVEAAEAAARRADEAADARVAALITAARAAGLQSAVPDRSGRVTLSLDDLDRALSQAKPRPTVKLTFRNEGSCTPWLRPQGGRALHGCPAHGP